MTARPLPAFLVSCALCLLVACKREERGYRVPLRAADTVRLTSTSQLHPAGGEKPQVTGVVTIDARRNRISIVAEAFLNIGQIRCDRLPDPAVRLCMAQP